MPSSTQWVRLRVLTTRTSGNSSPRWPTWYTTVTSHLCGRQTLVRFRHHALVLFTLARARQKTTAREIPDKWILNSLQHAFAALKDDGVLCDLLFLKKDADLVDKVCAWIQQVINFEVRAAFVPGEGPQGSLYPVEAHSEL